MNAARGKSLRICGSSWLLGVLALLFLLAPGRICAGDTRTVPLDMYLIIDASTAIQPVKAAVFQWVWTELVDELLQEGDSLTLWMAGNQATIVFSETLVKGTVMRQKDQILEQLRIMQDTPTTQDRADFTGALQNARTRITRTSTNHIEYTLVICGSSGGFSPSLTELTTSGLLRFSRVRDFSGWRVIIVALGQDARIQRAARGVF